MTRWAVITGEYPPQPGGVSDYTRLTARGLAGAGDTVQVYAPPTTAYEPAPDPGVEVWRLPGHFGPRSLAVLEAALGARPRPDRVLVQYVPHAFGWKAMNLPFALWVARRLTQLAPVWVMFHEVAFPFSPWSPKHALLGGVTRVMARTIAAAAERVFVSIPAWGDTLRRFCPRVVTPEWLPVPCTLEGEADPAVVAHLRQRLVPTGGSLVGHFGTFGSLIAALLAPTLTHLLHLVPRATILLIGRGSHAFRDRLVGANPDVAGRVISTGELPASEVAAHLRACGLVVQPFPDGVSSRRTSVMAALANGVPVVTNLGFLSETVWTDGTATVPCPDPGALAATASRLLANAPECVEVGVRGLRLYRERFALDHTIAALRGRTS